MASVEPSVKNIANATAERFMVVVLFVRLEKQIQFRRVAFVPVRNELLYLGLNSRFCGVEFGNA
jgi:hypothetical protein